MKLLFKQGTVSENDAYTGEDGEITIVTETNSLRLHDGVTPGGHDINEMTLGSREQIATMSGNLIDLTVPSWAKRLNLALFGVGVTDDTFLALQLGTSGGVLTSGYHGVVSTLQASTGVALVSSAVQLPIVSGSSSIAVFSGVVSLLKANDNTWSIAGNIARGGDLDQLHSSAGSITLSGELTTLRLLTDPSYTFDAGKVVLSCHG